VTQIGIQQLPRTGRGLVLHDRKHMQAYAKVSLLHERLLVLGPSCSNCLFVFFACILNAHRPAYYMRTLLALQAQYHNQQQQQQQHPD
jgi:hypothetical protein